jgi:hypothetical protein
MLMFTRDGSECTTSESSDGHQDFLWKASAFSDFKSFSSVVYILGCVFKYLVGQVLGCFITEQQYLYLY